MNRKRLRRQIFVLTPEEKRTIAFILCAVVLGVATKQYRDIHPRPPRPLSAKEQRAAEKAARLHRTSSQSISSPSPSPK